MQTIAASGTFLHNHPEGLLMQKGSAEVYVRLPRKEMMTVKRNQLIGGIGLLVLAALIFLFLETSASIPVAITLMVVGIALIATSRRR
jgi:hypothetical protein